MFYFKRNLPAAERLIRIALGLCVGVVTAVCAAKMWLLVVGFVTAATLAGTAVVGFCPACALAGRKPVREHRDARV